MQSVPPPVMDGGIFKRNETNMQNAFYPGLEWLDT